MPAVCNRLPIRSAGYRRSKSFVSVDGNALEVNGTTYKFGATNAYWLASYDSDSLYYLENWQIDDGFAMALAFGCSVVRSNTCGPTMGDHQFFDATGALNETAAKRVDYALARAADLGIRIVPPLVDNNAFYFGGIISWSILLGGNGSDFFTNQDVIDGFKTKVTAYLNRRNTVNNVLYKDDPTILCWELGNEIPGDSNTDAWQAQLADLLKDVAPNHLVKCGCDLAEFRAASVSNADIDILGHHYYADIIGFDVATVEADAAADIGGKPYLVLEYDWANIHVGGDPFDPDMIAAFIANTDAYAGVGFWSMRPHRTTFGFSPPGEPINYDAFMSGFPEPSRIEALRALHWGTRELTDPGWITPGVPRLSLSGGNLRWRAVSGATTYTMYRGRSATTGFFPIQSSLTDLEASYTPPEAGFYRVVAVNADRQSRPSNIVEVV